MGWLLLVGALLVLIGVVAVFGPFGVVIVIGGTLAWMAYAELSARDREKLEARERLRTAREREHEASRARDWERMLAQVRRERNAPW